MTTETTTPAAATTDLERLRDSIRGPVIDPDAGRGRLTFLDLDFDGADDSFLCDTGTRRSRTVR